MLPSHLSNIDFPIGLLKKLTTPSRSGRPPYEYSPLHVQQTARIAAQQHRISFPPPETQDSLEGDLENLPSQQGSFPEAATQFADHWNLQTLVQARFDPVRLPKVTPAFPLRGSLSKLDKLERSC